MTTTPAQDNSVAAQLARPFPAHDIEWRVQSSGTKTDGTPWAKVLAYVTARGIMERLDLVLGIGGWADAYTVGPGGGVVCRLSCKIDGEWVTKEDGAENTDVEAVKGGLSSALKRAAVKFGVGRYLYRLEEGWAVISDRGEYSAKTKEGNWFRWSPPALPAWAVEGGGSSPSPVAVLPATVTERASAAPSPVVAVKVATSAPAAAPASAGPVGGWRHVKVLPFIKKYAGRSLGDMDPRDLAWWSANFVPKEYKGAIQQRDVDFKAALLAGAAEVNGEGVQHHSSESARRAPTDDQLANLTPGDGEDVPY
jgi:hypothetical protein